MINLKFKVENFVIATRQNNSLSSNYAEAMEQTLYSLIGDKYGFAERLINKIHKMTQSNKTPEQISSHVLQNVKLLAV